MKSVVLIFLSALIGFLGNSSFAAHPEAKCETKHCLCSVYGDVGVNKIPEIKTFKDIVTSENPNRDLKNTCKNKKLTTYFEYDRSKLNSNDVKDIYQFVRTNYFAGGFYLEGFASSAGNAHYNQRLSQKRIGSVMDTIQRFKKAPMRVKASSYGERYASSSDSGSDRKVTIKPMHSFVELLNLTKTDYYLFDQSGSMKKHWSAIQNYKFHSPNVNVYLSTVNRCNHGIHLRQIGAFGDTHVWYSFWNLIDRMKPGSSVTIVSDFDTPIPLSQSDWSRIRSKLASKNIPLSKVHFIQIKGASLFRQITR